MYIFDELVDTTWRDWVLIEHDELTSVHNLFAWALPSYGGNSYGGTF